MAQISQIKSRIKSVESTLKITKAMKMISAARLSKARDRFNRIKPAIDEVEGVFKNVLGSPYARDNELCKGNEKGKVLLVPITTSRGFCGSFNSRIIHSTEILYKEYSNKNIQVEIAPIGSKATEYFNGKVNIVSHSEEVNHVWEKELYSQSKILYFELKNMFLEGEYREIRLVYNSFQSVLSQETVDKVLFPYNVSSRKLVNDKGYRFDFEYEPSEEKVVNNIFSVKGILDIDDALVETKVGEYSARMTAMDGANRNGEKLIKKLKIQFQRARQEAITREIAELIGGVECLRGEG